MNAFHGLRVAITGGTSGLGLALVRELVNRGARVAFVGHFRKTAHVGEENRDVAPGADEGKMFRLEQFTDDVG